MRSGDNQNLSYANYMSNAFIKCGQNNKSEAKDKKKTYRKKLSILNQINFLHKFKSKKISVVMHNIDAGVC